MAADSNAKSSELLNNRGNSMFHYFNCRMLIACGAIAILQLATADSAQAQLGPRIPASLQHADRQSVPEPASRFESRWWECHHELLRIGTASAAGNPTKQRVAKRLQSVVEPRADDRTAEPQQTHRQHARYNRSPDIIYESWWRRRCRFRRRRGKRR